MLVPFEKEIVVLPSLCDGSGRLGYPDAFGLFMDVAAEHAEALGIGLNAMAKRSLFWLTVKTQIRYFERPRMMERCTLRTWPEAPGRIRGDRSYQLLRGDSPLLVGKTEWAVTNLASGRLAAMQDVYPASMEFDTESAAAGPYARISDDFGGTEVFGVYTVRATDIDVGGHMNNAAYLRALFSLFPSEEIVGMAPKRIDAVFRAPCYEGDRLVFQLRDATGGREIRCARDDMTVLLVRIE